MLKPMARYLCGCELSGTVCGVATSDRKGRDGVNLSSTQRRVDIKRPTPNCRSVDDGLSSLIPTYSLGKEKMHVGRGLAPLRRAPNGSWLLAQITSVHADHPLTGDDGGAQDPIL